MTEEVKKDPLDDVVLNFTFTVAQINNLLHLLGNAPLPYVATAPFIMEINRQGDPQFKAALSALEKVKDEPKTAA
jgi:hypothetical protein